MTVQEKIRELGILPVIVIDDAADAVGLAQSLLDGGIYAAEITMRTEAGREAIEIMSKAYPDMLVGAGTVLTAEAAMQAISAGASFIVSPGLIPEVAQACAAEKIPYLPGIVTPTEISQALALGLTWLKFFPAEAFGGVSTIKALSAPFGNVMFMPTGGVTLDNLGSYLKVPSIYACGASFIAERKLINGHDWAEITRRCAEAVSTVKSIRESK